MAGDALDGRALGPRAARRAAAAAGRDLRHAARRAVVLVGLRADVRRLPGDGQPPQHPDPDQRRRRRRHRQTIVMLVGGIDLSVGGERSCSASVVIADSCSGTTCRSRVAIAGGLLAATALGVLNGVLVAVVGIEPILATLGTLLLGGGRRQADPRTAAGSRRGRVLRRRSPATHVVFDLPMDGADHVRAVRRRRVRACSGRRSAAASTPWAATAAPARLCGPAADARDASAASRSAGCSRASRGLLLVAQLGIVSQGDAAGLEFEAITAALIGGLSVTAGGVGRLEKTLLGAAHRRHAHELPDDPRRLAGATRTPCSAASCCSR